MIKDRLYSRMLEILLKNRKNDIIRVSNNIAAAERKEKQVTSASKKYKEAFGELAELTPEQLDQIKECWGDLWDGGFIDPFWVKMYTKATGTFDPAYVGNDLHFHYIETNSINWNYHRALLDKNFMDMNIPRIKHPEVLIRKVFGIYLDKDHNRVSEDEAAEIIFNCRDRGSVIKVSRVSSGGKGVYFVSEETTLEEIKDALNNDSNVNVQLLVRQHPAMAKMNESSVNTIRIITMMIDGESVPLSSCVRIGHSGSRVDNLSSGGVSCGIMEDGHLKSTGYSYYGDSCTVHSNGFVFSEGFIPDFDKILETVKACHYCVPMFGVISWDVALEEDGTPVLIEYNVGMGGIKIHQYSNGPVYGEYKDAIVKQSEKAFVKKVATLDYSYAKHFRNVDITAGSEYISSALIPDSVEGLPVKAIGTEAFKNHTALAKLTVSAEGCTIGYCAFYGCKALASVHFNHAVTIGRSAFNGCTSLTELVLPEGSDAIGIMAFKDCTSLTSITIPESVKTIGRGAFNGCEKVNIICSKGSAAHKYATKNEISFTLK